MCRKWVSSEFNLERNPCICGELLRVQVCVWRGRRVVFLLWKVSLQLDLQWPELCGLKLSQVWGVTWFSRILSISHRFDYADA